MVKIEATTHPAGNDGAEEYIKKALLAKVDIIHFDIMDGKFVPSKTFLYKKVLSLRKLFPSAKFALHLMIEDSEKTISQYLKSEPETIYLHVESFKYENDLLNVLQIIKEHNCKAGISLKPKTSISSLTNNLLTFIDAILVMGVEPGKSGQTIIESTINKVTELKQKYPNLEVAFDGGLNGDNFKLVKNAGADCLAFGSYLFKEITNGNGSVAVKKLKK